MPFTSSSPPGKSSVAASPHAAAHAPDPPAYPPATCAACRRHPLWRRAGGCGAGPGAGARMGEAIAEYDRAVLAPPGGGFLADVPTERISAARKYTSLPPILHGQSLLWGGASCGTQGVTELEECERCDDAWLKEVQEEFRRGELSEHSHAFLLSLIHI